MAEWKKIKRCCYECEHDNLRLTLSTEDNDIFCTVSLQVNNAVRYQHRFASLDGDTLESIKERALLYVSDYLQKEITAKENELADLEHIQDNLKKMNQTNE